MTDIRLVSADGIHMRSGALWGPAEGHPCRLISWPVHFGGRALTFAEVRALEARLAELISARARARVVAP